MRCAMADQLLSGLVVFALFLAIGQAQSGDSPMLLNPFLEVSDKNMTIELLINPKSKDVPINANMGITTLAPCGLAVMHTHSGGDELILGVTGTSLVDLAYANGTFTSAYLKPGQGFMVPRGLIHTLTNPDCNGTSVHLSFHTAVDSGHVSVAAAAWGAQGSPFRAYQNTTNQLDMQAAAIAPGSFAYDPFCMARCGFGERFGQQPAGVMEL